MKQYQDFVPKKSIQQLKLWIDELDVLIKIVEPRTTKLGDFRLYNGKFMISINNNLNLYAFLITLTHELAHAFVYKEHKGRIAPHGKEWKIIFKSMLLQFLSPDYFPNDILKALSLHARNPKASTLSDIKLSMILRTYDHNKRIMLSEINEGEEFNIKNGRVFIKGKKIRKRYRCIEKKTNRIYLFHPLTDVILIQ